MTTPTLTPDLTARDVLYKAANYISEYGHHKGEYYNQHVGTLTPPACALGALLAVTTDHMLQKEARRRIEWVLGYGVFPVGIPGSIAAWNDAHHTTAEDVILVLKKAAEL